MSLLAAQCKTYIYLRLKSIPLSFKMDLVLDNLIVYYFIRNSSSQVLAGTDLILDMRTDKHSCRGLFCKTTLFFIFLFLLRSSKQHSLSELLLPLREWANHLTCDLTDCQRMFNSQTCDHLTLDCLKWSSSKLPSCTCPKGWFYCCALSSVVFASMWLSLPVLLPVFSFPFMQLLVGTCSWAVMSQAKCPMSWLFFLHLFCIIIFF